MTFNYFLWLVLAHQEIKASHDMLLYAKVKLSLDANHAAAFPFEYPMLNNFLASAIINFGLGNHGS